ncbi:hypothetical protein HD806DRAFT_301196 [Xylariaceae sp. AK1471]|nr:hypothetical protein HD806DRAFT_301196 [Xylariaceae sp. AK1471]
MAIELQSSQAFVSHEVQLARDNSVIKSSSSDDLAMLSSNPKELTQAFTTCEVHLAHDNSVLKMKALPQRPGPGGSRVIRKRSSIPHLGDGLLNAFTYYANVTQSPVDTVRAPSEGSSILTSSNLNHLAKSTHPNEETALVCTPDLSVNSTSISRASSRSGTSHGDDSPPTTLTRGNSPFSSDEETTVDLLSSTPVNDKTLSSTETTPSPTFGWKGPGSIQSPTTRNKYQPPPVRGSSGINGGTHGQYPIVPHLAKKLSESFEPVPIDKKIEGFPVDETIPDAESLHGIVRGFLATEMNATSISLSAVETQHPPTVTPKRLDRPAPFWNLDKIFDFYLKGAITPEKAKETAKKHGYPDVIPVIDHVEAQKKAEPSPLGFDVELVIKPEKVSAAVPQQRQYDHTHHKFTQKLSNYSAEDASTGSTRPLHIFVDMSNIFIGFCNSWKISQNIPVNQYIRAPAFNFKVLTSIMQRNRESTKKILAGSVATAVSGPAQWPRYFVEAQAQGYKMNILNRVQKLSPVKVGRRYKTSPQGSRVVCAADMPTSGDESTEDQARVSYETRNGEQGVDEILHLNMMDSVVDCISEPGSMILATGDAAQAEFSDGFLLYATRALEKGWNLELVTWKKTISSAWMNPAFRNQYGQRFRIIYLDDFLDELNADLCPSLA